MARTGQVLPFDFPLPPNRLVYAPPPPSRSSQEHPRGSSEEINLRELDHHLTRFSAAGSEEKKVSSVTSTGRRKIKSSQLLASAECGRPEPTQRRATESAVQPTYFESFRYRRQPQASLNSPNRPRSTSRRITGLRPSPLPKHPRRDASLPTKTPVSSVNKHDAGFHKSQGIPNVIRNTGLKEPFPSPDSPTNATTARSSDLDDSDATCVESPFSAALDTLNLDSPLGFAALNLSWDWSQPLYADLQKTCPSPSPCASPTPIRPLSAKDRSDDKDRSDAKRTRVRFRSSGGTKGLRQGIPQAFKDAAFRSSRSATPTGDELDGVKPFPAGEARAVDDVTRSGWYSSDDEDGHGLRSRKFSLSFGKESLKRGWAKRGLVFRKGSV